MASVGTAFVEVKADLDNFNREIDNTGNSLAGRFKGFAAGATKALAVGLGAGIAGIAVLGKGAFEAAEEAQKVGKQTEAVIKSTGGAANISAAQVADLAGSISGVTGIDDETIQSAQNLLLTFTNVKNGVGEGTDVFNQATRTLVDMGAALGTDASGSAIQLGKALNDPIKGITALTRVGVTFSKEQIQLIHSLVESGDVMGAQKVILTELNKEFGGSAAAQATAADKMKVAFGNLQEQLGEVLIPVISKVATFLTTTLIPAVSRVIGIFKAEGFAGLFDRIKARISDAIPEVLAVLGDMLGALGDWITGTALPAIQAKLAEWGQAFVDWIGPRIVPALQELGRLLGAFGGWLLDTGLPLLVEKLKQWGKAFIDWIAPYIPPLLVEIGKLVGQLLVWLGTEALPKLIAKLVEWQNAFIAWVARAAAGLLAELPGLAGQLLSWIGDQLPGLAAKLGEWKDKFLGWVTEAAAQIPGKLLDFGLSIGHWLIFDAPGLIVDQAKGFGKAIIRAIIEGLSAIGGEIKSKIMSYVPSPGDIVGAIGGGARRIGSALNPFGATGGLVTSGGWITVGEKGPEAVKLPAGAQIASNGFGNVRPQSVDMDVSRLFSTASAPAPSRTNIITVNTSQDVVDRLRSEMRRQELLAS